MHRVKFPWRQHTAGFIAVLMILTLFSNVVYSAPAPQAQTAFDQKVIARLDIDNMWGHIQFLSEDIGPRVMGTTNEAIAADYIASVFAGYGYDVEFFEFPVSASRLLAEVRMLTPFPSQIYPAPVTRSALTTADGVTGEVVDWGSSLTPPEGAAGKIALIDVPAGSTRYTNFGSQVTAATGAGATAVVLVFGPDYQGQLGGNLSQNSSIPVVILNAREGAGLRSMMALDTVTLNIRVETGRTSRHVIATRKPNNKNKSSDEVLIIGAHYDSVHGAPGANDNLSSVAVLLEMARIFANYPLDRELRFMAFGAEEGGGGASRYVASLSAEEKERISGMINMEMLGSAYEPQDTPHIMTVNGSTNFMTDAFVSAGARLQTEVPTGTVSGSDHVAFHNAGIKAVCFARALPWTLPGGQYGLEPQYHTPNDTLEFMSPDRLLEAAEIAAAAAYDILRPATSNLTNSAVRK